MQYLIAVVINHDENYYYLVSNGKQIIIPIKTMHRMCTFDGLIDAKGLIKNGARLNLVEVKTDSGTVYYPNHKYYLNNKREKRQRLVGGSYPINPFSYSVEDEKLELKTSFSCLAGIKQTIVAFANSGHEGALCVGVNDKGVPLGLHGYYTPNEKQNIADNIRNQIKLETSSLEFSQTLKFQWESQNGLTICKIIVPTWTGDIIFLHKDKLYVRMNATNQLLKGNDMVNYIENRCRKTA